jgi:hypothetical protein
MPELPMVKKRGEDFPDRDLLVAATDVDEERLKQEYNFLVTFKDVSATITDIPPM